MLMVQDLNREQLDELKTSYFWQDETQDILPDDITFPEQIPDDIIFEHYDGVCFASDEEIVATIKRFMLRAARD